MLILVPQAIRASLRHPGATFARLVGLRVRALCVCGLVCVLYLWCVCVRVYVCNPLRLLAPIS